MRRNPAAPHANPFTEPAVDVADILDMGDNFGRSRGRQSSQRVTGRAWHRRAKCGHAGPAPCRAAGASRIEAFQLQLRCGRTGIRSRPILRHQDFGTARRNAHRGQHLSR